MDEHPILFSGEMVRAILSGRKTQTRRVVKLPNDAYCVSYWTTPTGKTMKGWANPGVNYWTKYGNHIDPCPYGQPGDRLWVRETWAHDDLNCRNIRCGNQDHIWYRASEIKIVADSFAGDARWRPSIHMPRWASRITLDVVSVRVERVQEISHNDACVEGAPSDPDLNNYGTGSIYVDWFADLWDKINASRGYGWGVNPWVWVVEFKVVEVSNGTC